MKIVSWNINSLRKRQDRLFAWLEATKPDVVCLQETKCPDGQFPALALRAVGYYSACHGEKSYNGVAILAKAELRKVRPSLCDEVVDPQARVIAATIGDTRVFSIYAPNGQAVGSTAYEYKLLWYRRLRDCIAKEKSGDLVVCGDFNVAPEENYAKSGCAIPFESITRKANFTAGGIIRCAHLKKIAAFASTRFWRAMHWRKDAAQPESILECAKARNRPITRRCGRSF
jgi:exodeoxyribonuclease III